MGRPKDTSRRGATARLALVGSLLLASGCAKAPRAAQPPPEAGYVTVKAAAVPLTVELPGRTTAFETSEVRPQVSGIITARLFEEGSIVHQGQTLYQIDASLYRAAVNQAQANLASVEAARENAVAKAARYKPLAQAQAIAQQDYSDAAANAKQSTAIVGQNAAALETARINLRYTRVAAPITGRISRSAFTTGALVTSGQADVLAVIQRLDPIYVDIQQSSAELVDMRQSLATHGTVPSTAAVQLRFENGTLYPLTGTLQFTEVSVDPSTGAVTLRARFPNPQGLLLPGMYVRASLSQATAQTAILVPQAGVNHDPQGNATVLLVGADGTALSRGVTADRTVGADWLVTQGLKSGDRVIVEGLGKIKPGQGIRAVPAGAPSQGHRGAHSKHKA
jgi:membrane fusion protein (multidrug efflux system)